MRARRRSASLEELLSEAPDAILVSVPTPDQESMPARIWESGLDVILEEPAPFERSGLARLHAIADRSGAALLPAFHDAYGVELHHLRTQLRSGPRADHGSIRRIRSLFTDPYLANETPAERLQSLHGSWHDSGVNAFSVVCTLEHRLNIESCRMKALEGYGARVTVATYRRSLPPEAPTLAVETDWTRDEKRRETRMECEEAAVILEEKDKAIGLLRSRSALPWLTDQYMSPFRDLVSSRAANERNRRFSLRVHDLLCDSLENASS